MNERQRIRRHAVISIVLLSLFGLLSIIFFVRDWTVSLPLILTYGALVYDTFFSIRYFFSITPNHDHRQGSVDLILFLCYGVIAWNLANPLGFMYSIAVMFAIASLKYVLLRRRIGSSVIITRKIRFDLFGVLAYSAVTIPIFFGWVWQASWVLFGLYVLVNIQILWRNPLYPYNPGAPTSPLTPIDR